MLIQLLLGRFDSTFALYSFMRDLSYSKDSTFAMPVRIYPTACRSGIEARWMPFVITPPLAVCMMQPALSQLHHVRCERGIISSFAMNISS